MDKKNKIKLFEKMESEKIKLNLIQQIMRIRHDSTLKKVAEAIEKIENEPDPLKRLATPIKKCLDIEELKKKQNFQPINKASFFQKIDDLAIEESIDDLLSMI